MQYQVVISLLFIHTFAEEWTSDEDSHWHVCTGCEEISDKAEHTWDEGVVTTEATCVSKGLKEYKCTVCGKVLRTEEFGEILYSTPVDAETNEAATAASTYIYFGAFPQTVLPLTSEITIDESRSITRGINTYYLGSDGEYYVKATENTQSSSYKYSDGTNLKKISEESTRYFKVEPIKWKVITKDYNNTGKALLLAENILNANILFTDNEETTVITETNTQTDPEGVEFTKTYTYTEIKYPESRTVGDKTIYNTNYEYSLVRAYLNGLDYYRDTDTTNSTYKEKGFLQTAFASTSQQLIAETTVKNDGESTQDEDKTIDSAAENESGIDYTCDDTVDKIFLLSIEEASKTEFGFTGTKQDDARIRTLTDYAGANYGNISGRYWWLRSPCYYNDIGYVWIVDHIGFLEDSPSSNRFACSDYGIVPAMTISLE